MSPQMSIVKRHAVILILSAAAIVAIAIGVRALRSPQPAQTPETPGLPPAPTAQLRLAPDTEITMYQGEAAVGGSKIALSDLWTGGKPVVLNFWAGLCPPCRAEMPDFQRVYDERGAANAKFAFIGVDIGPFIGLGSREDAKALLRELKVTFPAGTTFDERTIRNYEILGMPTTVFITPDGKILRKHTGLLTYGQMNLFIDELLRASGTR